LKAGWNGFSIGRLNGVSCCGTSIAATKWCELHRDDLLAGWLLAEQHQPLLPIDPLD